MTITPAEQRPIERPAPNYPAAAAGLVEWAQAADAAYQLATKLVSTSFAPQSYRGKPEEGAAAILAGSEVGLSPMASLKAFDNIQGVATPKAMTLRAIVQSLGHDVELVQTTDVLAVVRGRRKGSSNWQTVEWSIDRARGLGLTTKDNWKKQPGAMLVARATAEVCRLIASDAILGMPYSTEEVGDDFAELAATTRPTPAPAQERPRGLRARAALEAQTIPGRVEPAPLTPANPVVDVEPAGIVEQLRHVADHARDEPPIEEPPADDDPSGWAPVAPQAELGGQPAEETPKERALRIGREARQAAEASK